MKDVTYTDSSNDGFVYNTKAYDGKDEDLTISVIGGTFKAAAGFCGLTPGSSIKGATIETTGLTYEFPAVEATGIGTNSLVEDSKITSDGHAVTAGYGGNVEVKDCEVSGGEYAYCVLPSGGEIIVEGGSYVGALYIYDEFQDNAPVDYLRITVDGEVKAELTR